MGNSTDARENFDWNSVELDEEEEERGRKELPIGSLSSVSNLESRMIELPVYPLFDVWN
jgi:hypothetical protein